VLSDGEVQEGSTWEAIMMASSFGCSNLVAFVASDEASAITGSELTVDCGLGARYAG